MPYTYTINKFEKMDIKHFYDLKVFIEYSNDAQDVYKFIKSITQEKRKVLTVFHDIIADVIGNENLNSMITELFIKLKT